MRGIKWNYIFIGFWLALMLIIRDEIQRKRDSDFRFQVLAVAVGVYLPLGLSVLILIDGLLSHWLKKKSRMEKESVKKQTESKGLLLASGLITREALMGGNRHYRRLCDEVTGISFRAVCHLITWVCWLG